MRNLILLIGFALVVGCGSSAPAPETSSSPGQSAVGRPVPAAQTLPTGRTKSNEAIGDHPDPSVDNLPQPTTSATPAHLR